MAQGMRRKGDEENMKDPKAMNLDELETACRNADKLTAQDLQRLERFLDEKEKEIESLLTDESNFARQGFGGFIRMKMKSYNILASALNAAKSRITL